MINFAPLRTKRLSVRLREISMIDAIRLCAIPPENHESATTEFLQCVIEKAEAPSSRHVTDPRSWSVQERMLVVGHYLSHMGTPNFELGGNSRYSDYLLSSNDIGEYPVVVGDVGGDIWSISPLSGASAEAIERLVGDIPHASGRFHWICGCMAAQLSMASEDRPDELADFNGYLEWLEKRITVFAYYPESEWVAIFGLYLDGCKKIKHFFDMDVDQTGIVAKPISEVEAGANPLPPARFPVSTFISEVAHGFGGKP